MKTQNIYFQTQENELNAESPYSLSLNPNEIKIKTWKTPCFKINFPRFSLVFLEDNGHLKKKKKRKKKTKTREEVSDEEKRDLNKKRKDEEEEEERPTSLQLQSPKHLLQKKLLEPQNQRDYFY